MTSVCCCLSFCANFCVGCVEDLQIEKHQKWVAQGVTIIKVLHKGKSAIFPLCRFCVIGEKAAC